MEIPAQMESRLIDSKSKPAVSQATAFKVLPMHKFQFKRGLYATTK
jgi:hypothetical protein